MHHTHQPMPLDKIFGEAWKAVNGVKLPFFVALLGAIILIIFIILLMSLTAIFIENAWLRRGIELFASGVLGAPLFTGFLMMGVLHVRGQSIRWFTAFHYYRLLPRLFLTYLIAAALSWVFMMALCIPSFILLSFFPPDDMHVYLISASVILFIFSLIYNSLFMFNFILVVDKNDNPFIAWWHSCKKVAPHFGKVFLALIYITIINILGICLLGVGLIWTLPLTYLVIAKMYLFCEHDREHPDLIEE